jgi:hypothetical protein
MFQNNQIVEQQTRIEPETANHFGPGAWQRPEPGSRLISLPFDSVINHYCVWLNASRYSISPRLLQEIERWCEPTLRMADFIQKAMDCSLSSISSAF